MLPIKNKGNIVIKLEQSSIDNIIVVIKQNNYNQNNYNQNNYNQSTSLCGAFILTEPNNIKGYENMKGKVEKIFNDENNLGFENLKFDDLSPLEKRSIDSMLGMGIGDAYGAVFEFKPVNSDLYNADNYNKKIKSNEDWEWNNNETCSGWTDDSSMGLCLADSLIVNNGYFTFKALLLAHLSDKES